MILPIQIKWYNREYCQAAITAEGDLNGFPLLSIDSESYMDGGEIQSGVNFPPHEGRHCIAIGKSCSLASGIV